MVDTPIGTNSPTYALVSGDLGATIYCRVTASNASGSSNAITNVVGPVTGAVAPVNTVLPAIADTTPEVTVAVSCTTGTWTGDPTILYAYQWKSGGTNVGTDSSSYTPVVGDIGATLQCVVTATNGAGSSSANSNTTGAVAAAPSYTGPGQVVSGATGYWGLRGYNASYTGPALDLHNTSTGAFVATINILTGGALDVATAATHIGAGAAKVGKLYDQVGSNHLEEPDTDNTRRPTLVLNAIGARPALLFTAVQGFRSVIVTVTRAQPFTVSTYTKITNSTGATQALITTGGGPYLQADWGTSTSGTIEPLMNAGTDIFGAVPANVWRGTQAVFNGASSDLNMNGTAMSGSAGSGGVSSAAINLCGEAGGSGIAGYLTEFGIWPSAFSGANSSAMYANQAAWWV